MRRMGGFVCLSCLPRGFHVMLPHSSSDGEVLQVCRRWTLGPSALSMVLVAVALVLADFTPLPQKGLVKDVLDAFLPGGPLRTKLHGLLFEPFNTTRTGKVSHRAQASINQTEPCTSPADLRATSAIHAHTDHPDSR